MPAALHLADYGVGLLLAAALVAVGAYFRFVPGSVREFLWAGRSLGSFPGGLSLAMLIVAGEWFRDLPGTGYLHGSRVMGLVLGAWLVAPPLLAVGVPLLSGLGLGPFEYFELRYAAHTRRVAAALSVAGRWLALCGLLALEGRVLMDATALGLPAEGWLLLVGLSATLLVASGGLRSVAWAETIAWSVVAIAIAAIVGTLWSRISGGPERVWFVARGLGRTELVDSRLPWESAWSVWRVVPFAFLSILAELLFHPAASARLVAARSERSARRMILVELAAISVAVPLLVYVGQSLLAFYYDHPEAMRAVWVVDLDGVTHRTVTDRQRDAMAEGATAASVSRAGVSRGGKPLVGWSETLDASSVERLVAERRLLLPNSKLPVEDARDALQQDDQEQWRLDVSSLAMRHPAAIERGLSLGEPILHERSGEELLPRLVATRLPLGVAGLTLTLCVGMMTSLLANGILATTQQLLVDLRASPLPEAAAPAGFTTSRITAGGSATEPSRTEPRPSPRPPSQQVLFEQVLSKQQSARSPRPAACLVGITTVLVAVAIARWDAAGWFVAPLAVVLGPLLATFVLGLLARHVSARAATASLAIGTLAGFAAMATQGTSLARAWRWETKLTEPWPLLTSMLATALAAVLLSPWFPDRRPRADFRGLVLGIGTLGKRGPS